MAKDRVERQLEHLKAVRAGGVSDAAIKELRKALGDRVNLIAAKAATIAGEWEAQTLLPDVQQAFQRMLEAPESDPQCAGKNALSKTLKDLGWAESGLFLKGLKHHQFEATWGGKIDTAATLRSTCALALVQCVDLTRDEILTNLVDALTELDPLVRTEAARALEQVGGRDAVLLLRLKARTPESEFRVTGQVFGSLLQMEGTRAVGFIAEFLQDKKEDVAEEAALALGASRLLEAFQSLQTEFMKPKSKCNPAILLRAISASRLDTALEFLLETMRTGRPRMAEDALRALELHKESEDIVERVRAVVADRDELQTLFRERFAQA